MSSILAGDDGLNEAALSQAALTIMDGDHSTWEAANFLPFGNGGQCNGNLARPGAVGTPCEEQALNNAASQRHLEGANYAFADGHVKWYKPARLFGSETPFSVSQGSPTFRVRD